EDLNLPVRIVPCETVRESDGLAMSSRNVYLTAEQREQAIILHEALERAAAMFTEPGMTPAKLTAALRDTISRAPLAEIDYAELLTYPDLETPSPHEPFDAAPAGSRWIAALAVKFGATRLIDNRLLVMTTTGTQG